MCTAKEICDNVPRSVLDSPISDIHISEISSHITKWRELAPNLGISNVDEEDIVESNPDNPKLQRREALCQWKESLGNMATYRRLICILCSQRRVRTAQRIKDLLTHKKSKRVLESDAVMSDFFEELSDIYSDEKQHPSFLQ